MVLFISLGHVVRDLDLLRVETATEFMLQIPIRAGLNLVYAIVARICSPLFPLGLEFLLALNQHFDAFCYNSYDNNE